MIKFLHTADWQLGADGHEPQVRDQILPHLFETAKEHKVDFILVVGDVFDKPNPTQKVKDDFLQNLLTYKIPIVFTVGNHDYTDKKKSYHSLELVKLLYSHAVVEHAIVIESGSCYTLSLDNELILIRSLPDNLEEMPKKYEKQDIPTISCWHGILPGMNIKNLDGKQDTRITKKILKKTHADYFALGDIHKRMKFGRNCAYPGALHQKTFSDEDGMLLVKLSEGKVSTKELRLSLPKKINLKVEIDRNVNEEEIIDYIKDNSVSGNSVRLKFSLPQEIYSAIDKEYIRKELSSHVLKLKFDNEPIQEERKRKNLEKVAKAQTIEEELRIVIEEENKDLDEDLLLAHCKRYVG